MCEHSLYRHLQPIPSIISNLMMTMLIIEVLGRRAEFGRIEVPYRGWRGPRAGVSLSPLGAGLVIVVDVGHLSKGEEARLADAAVIVVVEEGRDGPSAVVEGGVVIVCVGIGTGVGRGSVPSGVLSITRSARS